MNAVQVARLELCEELLQLSGWLDCSFEWAWPSARSATRKNSKLNISEPYVKGMRDHNKDVPTHASWLPEFIAPAYDLGYILRKLPEIRLDIWHNGHVVIKYFTHNGVPSKLERKGEVVKAEADNPEDAAVKLCISLIKQGILHPSIPGGEG